MRKPELRPNPTPVKFEKFGAPRVVADNTGRIEAKSSAPEKPAQISTVAKLQLRTNYELYCVTGDFVYEQDVPTRLQLLIKGKYIGPHFERDFWVDLQAMLMDDLELNHDAAYDFTGLILAQAREHLEKQQ